MMKEPRVEALVEKLTRGIAKSFEIFHSVEPGLWEQPIFDDPGSWNLKDLVAHFVYSEENLQRVARDIATGGEGYPEDIDIDAFNEREMEKLRHRSVEELLADLKDGRTGLIEWVGELSELELDREGRHPVLGVANVETVIFSIYAHQLLHMREMAPRLRK